MRANSPCGCSPWHAPWNQPVHKLLGNARTRVLFLHFAADCLDNLKLVWINHFDLGFVRYKGRDTNIRQRRSELDVVRTKFSGGTPLLQCVSRVKCGSKRDVLLVEAFQARVAVEKKRAIIKCSGFAPEQIAVSGVE